MSIQKIINYRTSDTSLEDLQAIICASVKPARASLVSRTASAITSLPGALTLAVILAETVNALAAII